MGKIPFIKVTLTDALGSRDQRLINENLVESVEEIAEGSLVTMSSGKKLYVTHPPYEDWENDLLSRKD